MSRSIHGLRSAAWYGNWATYFHRENREMRQRGREKRLQAIKGDAESGVDEYDDEREERE